jgi:hypothetical protein
VPPRHDFYVLNTGQLDLAGEGRDDGYQVYLAKFADGGRDVLSLEGAGPDRGPYIYARTAASPTNGDDNRPSVSDGRCSMVGDWDVPATSDNPSVPASTWSFDGLGNFVVGPPGAITCDAHSMHGTYRLSASGYFQITTNWNLGLCDWSFNAAYPATFDAGCTSLMTRQDLDNCTGGRGYFNGNPTVLTRRR